MPTRFSKRRGFSVMNVSEIKSYYIMNVNKQVL